jgi:hypothetical protein
VEGGKRRIGEKSEGGRSRGGIMGSKEWGIEGAK